MDSANCLQMVVIHSLGEISQSCNIIGLQRGNQVWLQDLKRILRDPAIHEDHSLQNPKSICPGEIGSVKSAVTSIRQISGCTKIRRDAGPSESGSTRSPARLLRACAGENQVQKEIRGLFARRWEAFSVTASSVADHPFYWSVQFHSNHFQTRRVTVDEVIAEKDSAKVGQHDDVPKDTSIEIVAFDLVYQRAQDMTMFGKLFV